ncbi:hypothetical protein CsSME_00051311 [Camellia sinensis var. sinensis]
MEDKGGQSSVCFETTVEEDVLEHYFHKVKLLCREISELDPEAQIGETRVKRIIIHVQGWQNQPSRVEFENLLAGQEALAKQMGGVSLKGEEEALYAYKGRWNAKQHTVGKTKKNEDKEKSNQGERSTRVEGDSKNPGTKKKFEGKCYNCGKKGHKAKDCWSKKGLASFVAIEELSFTAITSEQIDYEKDWIRLRLLKSYDR